MDINNNIKKNMFIFNIFFCLYIYINICISETHASILIKTCASSVFILKYKIEKVLFIFLKFLFFLLILLLDLF